MKLVSIKEHQCSKSEIGQSVQNRTLMPQIGKWRLKLDIKFDVGRLCSKLDCSKLEIGH